MDSTPHSRRLAPTLGRVLAMLAVGCLAMGAVAQASAATFDPNSVISNSNMRDYDSMSVAEIQAFLEAQTGSLGTLVTADYDKVITLSKTKSNVNTTRDKGETPKPASRIIWEACQAWKINPKVMLTMLQKEQSLLSAKPKAGSTTLARAIGAGCPGGLVYPDKKSANYNPVATNRYPGFGNQIWHGARLLDGYGEGKNGSTIPLYYPGIVRKDIYRKVTLHPSNLATYKLYVYNPSIGAKAPYGDLSTQACSGNANFWKIYRKHFGGTYANPRMRRVFRLRNRHNGTYLYTTSVTERYHKTSKHSATWGYAGAAFSVDTSVTTASTVPVYRFYNKLTHKYSFVRSHSTYLSRRSVNGRKKWSYGGIAFRVAGKSSKGSVPVYSLVNRWTGGRYLTSSTRALKSLRATASLRRTWTYEGVTFHLPRVATP